MRFVHLASILMIAIAACGETASTTPPTDSGQAADAAGDTAANTKGDVPVSADKDVHADGTGGTDNGAPVGKDVAVTDTGAADAGSADAGKSDAGMADATATDAGSADAGAGASLPVANCSS